MQHFRTILFLPAVLGATPALAHTGVAATHGFHAGFLHPIAGLDHGLAMVAVGTWAGLVGARAGWAWPTAFVSAMALGALLGINAVPLPAVELCIALSVVLLGAVVALRASLPLVLGVILSGGLALAHGHAHGAEIPGGADAATYMLGFTFSTLLMHMAGLLAGDRLSRTERHWMPGLTGGAVAAAGLVLAIG